MRLWRLSSARRAREFDGGYGLSYNGRCNTKGRPVTYCATVPSLAALEKRVHASDPGLLPRQALVEYALPARISRRTIRIADLPADWPNRENVTQRLGDEWLDAADAVILIVPSIIMPIERAPDRNVLINHRHGDIARVAIASIAPFTLDPRLFDL
jgi:RES domain-containing protein